jgi:hypothetical protein
MIKSLMVYPEKMGQPSIKVTIPGRAGRNSTITARAATMTTKQIASPPHSSRERGPAEEETGVASTTTDTCNDLEGGGDDIRDRTLGPRRGKPLGEAGTREPAACSMGRRGHAASAVQTVPEHHADHPR